MIIMPILSRVYNVLMSVAGGGGSSIGLGRTTSTGRGCADLDTRFCVDCWMTV